MTSSLFVTKHSSLLKGFLKKPKMVASIISTSESSARHIAECAKKVKPKVIVEYGPGTGPITKELLEILPSDGKLFAIESYEPFVTELRETLNDPRLTVLKGDVMKVRSLLPENTTADVVISGVPFSHMPAAARTKLMAETASLLRSDGVFLVYQVRNDVEVSLKKQFGDVQHERLLLNIPPLHFYEAKN